MPLVTCPDCGNQVSDRAPACPKCGGPIVAPARPLQAGDVLLAADALEPTTESYIEEAAASRVSVARQIAGGIVLVLIIGGLGLFHVVRTESGATFVPKEHFTYSMTFTSVPEVL